MSEINGLTEDLKRLSAGTSASFDPYDWNTLYFGKISRLQSDELLKNTENGTFVIRDSSQPGAFALDVKEYDREAQKNRISHYLIFPADGEKYQIGNITFPNIGTLLNHYKMHYLETSSLIQPAPRLRLPKMVAKFDFPGPEANDLPFKKGDFLWILNKGDSNSEWWTAKDELGRTGQIPANYVAPPEEQRRGANSDSSGSSSGKGNSIPSEDQLSDTQMDKRNSSPRPNNTISRKLPALAKVIQERVPNAYDKSALRLRVNDVIQVTKINPSGTWEGTLNGKSGTFPMTYIEWSA